MSSIQLHTARLILRDLQISDLNAVHAYASDERVTCHQAWGPNTLEQTRAFVESGAAEAASAIRLSFNLGVVLGTGELIGACFCAIQPDGHEAEIGYSFNPGFWGRGYASEAAERLVRFLLEERAVHRVIATCSPLNTASINVLRRLGFQLEGHLREHKLIRGTYRDSLIWAKLSATPPRDGSQAGMAVVAQSAKEHG